MLFRAWVSGGRSSAGSVGRARIMTGRGREPGAQPTSKMSLEVTVIAARRSDWSAYGKSQEKMRLRWNGVKELVSMEGMLEDFQLNMKAISCRKIGSMEPAFSIRLVQMMSCLRWWIAKRRSATVHMRTDSGPQRPSKPASGPAVVRF